MLTHHPLSLQLLTLWITAIKRVPRERAELGVQPLNPTRQQYVTLTAMQRQGPVMYAAWLLGYSPRPP